MEKSQVNATINKYLGQLEISTGKGEEEVNKVIDALEKLTGFTFTPEERASALKGELTKLKETFKELDMSSTTIFFWDKVKDLPCIGDHMIYGFLKAAAEAIGRTMEKKNGKVLHSISYTQSLINQHVRCEGSFVTFNQDLVRAEDGKPAYLQRSLRAMTAQGPRIALAKSEIMSTGAELTFVLKVLDGSDINNDVLATLFDYGQQSGLGQWRNSGHGQFSFDIKKVA